MYVYIYICVCVLYKNYIYKYINGELAITVFDYERVAMFNLWFYDVLYIGFTASTHRLWFCRMMAQVRMGPWTVTKYRQPGSPSHLRFRKNHTITTNYNPLT